MAYIKILTKLSGVFCYYTKPNDNNLQLNAGHFASVL
jgi:hypothetical protein